jgi:hypothetical protein
LKNLFSGNITAHRMKSLKIIGGSGGRRSGLNQVQPPMVVPRENGPAAEPSVAPDCGGIAVFQSLTSHLPPQQVNWCVRCGRENPMGMGYNDIYVLAPRRSAEVAFQFLDRFVKHREPAASEYQFPERADRPEATFTNPSEAIVYGIADPTRVQRFYFHNSVTGEPAHAMVFLTADGGMVLGVSVSARQEDRVGEGSDVARWLEQLKEATDAKVGYALYESPPPCETVADFVGGLNVAWLPKLVDGRLVRPTSDEECGVVHLDWSTEQGGPPDTCRQIG